MRLLEYEAKEILEREGVRVPVREICKSIDGLRRASFKIGFPVVLKAQIPVGYRGRMGCVRAARNLKELMGVAGEILGGKFGGYVVEEVMVEEMIDSLRELYLGITFDRERGEIAVICSPEGGVEIEEEALRSPSKVFRVYVNPLVGLRDYMVRETFKFLGLPREYFDEFSSLVRRLHNVFSKYDCELVEINPLAMTNEGLVALDAKMVLDDNALYRQGEIKGFLERRMSRFNELERKAFEMKVTYVELDGSIGVIGSGAGLTLTNLDLINLYGGKPANFLDLADKASKENVEEFTALLLKRDRVKGVLASFICGLLDGEEVAEGIVSALEKVKVSKPVVVRLSGRKADLGRKVLEGRGLQVFESMEESAKKIVELVGSEHTR